MALAAGAKLGRYEIRSQLGAGGMGEVYLARDSSLDRKVALKILPPQLAEDKDRMSRFVREAKLASALNHPNIITIHEIGEIDGTHFITTEYIEGETLKTRLERESFSLKSTLEIALQVTFFPVVLPQSRRGTQRITEKTFRLQRLARSLALKRLRGGYFLAMRKAKVKSDNLPPAVLPRVNTNESIKAREVSSSIVPICGLTSKDDACVTNDPHSSLMSLQ